MDRPAQLPERHSNQDEKIVHPGKIKIRHDNRKNGRLRAHDKFTQSNLPRLKLYGEAGCEEKSTELGKKKGEDKHPEIVLPQKRGASEAGHKIWQGH